MKTSFSRVATVVALAFAVVAPAAHAQAKEGSFVVRLRALLPDLRVDDDGRIARVCARAACRAGGDGRPCRCHHR